MQRLLQPQCTQLRPIKFRHPHGVVEKHALGKPPRQNTDGVLHCQRRLGFEIGAEPALCVDFSGSTFCSCLVSTGSIELLSFWKQANLLSHSHQKPWLATHAPQQSACTKYSPPSSIIMSSCYYGVVSFSTCNIYMTW